MRFLRSNYNIHFRVKIEKIDRTCYYEKHFTEYLHFFFDLLIILLQNIFTENLMYLKIIKNKSAQRQRAWIWILLELINSNSKFQNLRRLRFPIPPQSALLKLNLLSVFNAWKLAKQKLLYTNSECILTAKAHETRPAKYFWNRALDLESHLYKLFLSAKFLRESWVFSEDFIKFGTHLNRRHKKRDKLVTWDRQFWQNDSLRWIVSCFFLIFNHSGPKFKTPKHHKFSHKKTYITRMRSSIAVALLNSLKTCSLIPQPLFISSCKL